MGAPCLLLNLGRAERHAVHKLLAHYFNRLASSPKQMVPSRFNVCFRFLSFSNCERSSSNCNYLHTRMGHIQTFTCIDVTPRRLAVDPHISTVTFLIKCGRLCLCFVLVLFPNVKLWFILVWQSFFFLFEFWNPIFSIFSKK